MTEKIKIGDQEYKTVKIGKQIWLAENLKVTRYRNGDEILEVTVGREWDDLSTGAYCAYRNWVGNANTYGYLYNWFAVSDKQNIAPEGWHVPTDDEWKVLEKVLGMSQAEADYNDYRSGSPVGSKLAGRADLWDSGDLKNNGAFGESGFSALPGGSRGGHRNDRAGFFGDLGDGVYFWSSTEYDSGNAWYRHLRYFESGVYRRSCDKRRGFSLRLVRD